MRQFPLFLLARAVKLWLCGRVRFSKDMQDLRIEDRGEIFAAFRNVVVTPRADQPSEPGAIFRVRFHFKSLSLAANKRLSLVPIPLIVAQPGFRSKTWLIGADSNDFMGYYEFDTEETARAYWDSLPLRLMRRRAAPGSLSHEISRARHEG